MTPIAISDATLRKVRDYVINEPSYTVAFAAWDTGMSQSVIGAATATLLKKGIVAQIEERHGPYAAVYAYVPATEAGPRSRLFPELDENRSLGIGTDAPARGKVVPHTRSEGTSGKPGRDRKRQAQGVRVKRRRQGT